jgi:long-chain acyl-CoA synthetase
MKIYTTLMAYVDEASRVKADDIWLRDRVGDNITEWSWSQARAEINSVAAWLEKKYGASNVNMALLSRNRAHWFLADLAIINSGNVSIPLFTTLGAPTAEYIFGLTEARVLFLGESANWNAVQAVLPDSVEIVTLPGVEIDAEHTTWSDIVAECADQEPVYKGKHDDLITIVFTSGTTGVPKGVMQTHSSLLVPMQKTGAYFEMEKNPRFLSYLPLSHMAELQLVFVQSLLYAGSVAFNESLATLARDMVATRPNFFFGAPRVWEQLQQRVLAKFGSQKALTTALDRDAAGVGSRIRRNLGLDQANFLLTAAAPIPPALIRWYQGLGLNLMEGFGQTEIMATTVNTADRHKTGSIGRVVDGIGFKITDEGELAFSSKGAAIGYYKMPEKTAETFIDGWVLTGDKGYIDDDGFVFLTGRVKDYFKTIQGKYVAPAPIESSFAANEWTEQLCLLGRGYSKTAIVCVLSSPAQEQDPTTIDDAMRSQVRKVNAGVEKHARIGAVLISKVAWTIENDMLTPTLKIRRDEVENQFGERARELAREAAVQRTCRIEWTD